MADPVLVQATADIVDFGGGVKGPRMGAAVASGNLLLVYVNVHNEGTTPPAVTTDGWHLVATLFPFLGTKAPGRLYAKKADGTSEDGGNFTGDVRGWTGFDGMAASEWEFDGGLDSAIPVDTHIVAASGVTSPVVISTTVDTPTDGLAIMVAHIKSFGAMTLEAGGSSDEIARSEGAPADFPTLMVGRVGAGSIENEVDFAPAVISDYAAVGASFGNTGPGDLECDFSISTTTAIVGHPVSFTDESTGSPDGWLWDFGDGETSTDQNPTHVYDEPGTYTVSLTVTRSSDDEECTETKVDILDVVEAEAWDIYDADALTGPLIATLVNAKGRWIRSELHGLGEGGFTINRHAFEATEDNFAEGNMVKVRIADCGPDYIDGFFLPGEGDYTLLSAQGGQGREDLVFRGLGALSYLDRARMTPCAFSIPPDLVGTWDKVWVSKAVGMPSGVAFDPDQPNFVYVIGASSRKIRKLNQTTLEVASSSPALWSGSNKWAAGLSFDPDDDTICWVLEAPWLSGSTANTKIRKVRRSDWEVLDTWDLGDPVKLTDIRVDGDFVWTTRYDNDLIQQRSKSNAANVVDSFTISYKGKVQRKPNGIAINGTKIAYWFGGDGGGGTGRALIADTSDPEDITDVQRTNGISAFGGEWTTESGEDFLYTVSYTEGKTWKYQLTESVPACADDSGTFHPEQVAPGALAWRILVEITHEDRPVSECPELSFDFTEDEDSNGTPWPARTSTEEFTWQVGDRAYSDVLARLIPAGVTFDLDVNTMTLHAYVDAGFGTDRTSGTFAAGKVRFVEAVNLAANGDLRRRDNRGQPDTYITVAGQGGRYGDATLAGRYVRHGFMQVSGRATSAILDAIGEDELARQRLVSDALGFETLWGDAEDPGPAELAGRYIPKRHYWKGDLVRIDMTAGEFTYQEEDLRIYGTLITERDGKQVPGGEVVPGWRSAIDLGSPYKVPDPITVVPPLRRGGPGGGPGPGGVFSVSTPDGEVEITGVTRIVADGVTSPEPGVAVIPTNVDETPEPPLLEELATDEMDTALVPHPDGAGNVVWGEDTGGEGEGDVFARDLQVAQTGRYLDREGQWRDPLLIGDQALVVASAAAAIAGDTKYHAWPDVKRLRDGRYIVVWTRGDTHNADNTGVVMAMIGVENLDLTFTWGTPWVVYDHASQWVSATGVSVLSTGRVVITAFIHSFGSDPVDGAFVLYSDDVEENGASSSWTAPITVNSSLTSYSYGATHVVELPLGGVLGGPGRLVQFVEGKNTGNTHSRVVGLVSDDGGDTWGSQFAVAGDGTTRNYYEPSGGMLSDGRIMVLLRTSDGDGDIYVIFAQAPYTTFSAPALAFAGHGQPNWIESSTRTILAATRKNEGVGVGDTIIYATTAARLDVDVTDWEAAFTFDSTMTEMEYASICETSVPARYLVVEGYQPTSSTTNSDIYAGVVTEGLVDIRDAITVTVDAEDVAITDAGGYFTGTDVEAALQEIGAGGAGLTAAAIAALGFVGPIVMADGITSPPEPLFTEDGTDYLYADL